MTRVSPDSAHQLPRALAPNDVVGVVGKRGTGKSTCVKGLSGELLKLGDRVCAFDPHDEYSRLGRVSEHVRLGPLRERCTVEDLLRDQDRLDDPHLSLAVVPRKSPHGCAEDFRSWLDLITNTGNLVAVVEELGYFAEHCEDDVNELATQSRHAGIPVIMAAQRMVQIPSTARTQLSWLVTFLQDSPRDLEALADLAAVEGKLDWDFAVRVSRLPEGVCEVWRDRRTNHPKEAKS